MMSSEFTPVSYQGGRTKYVSDNDYIKVNKNDKKIIQVLYVVLWNVNQIEMQYYVGIMQ